MKIEQKGYADRGGTVIQLHGSQNCEVRLDSGLSERITSLEMEISELKQMIRTLLEMAEISLATCWHLDYTSIQLGSGQKRMIEKYLINRKR